MKKQAELDALLLEQETLINEKNNLFENLVSSFSNQFLVTDNISVINNNSFQITFALNDYIPNNEDGFDIEYLASVDIIKHNHSLFFEFKGFNFNLKSNFKSSFLELSTFYNFISDLEENLDFYSFDIFLSQINPIIDSLEILTLKINKLINHIKEENFVKIDKKINNILIPLKNKDVDLILEELINQKYENLKWVSFYRTLYSNQIRFSEQHIYVHKNYNNKIHFYKHNAGRITKKDLKNKLKQGFFVKNNLIENFNQLPFEVNVDHDLTSFTLDINEVYELLKPLLSIKNF